MKSSGTLYAISISEERGQFKHEVKQARLIENFGIENDGHAGDWGRQVTCLDKASVDKANKLYNLNIGPGGFAENLLIEGIDLAAIKVGDRLQIGDSIILQVTQIGKEDHPSVVSKAYGVSLLPFEGIFCRVLKGGIMCKGDPVEVIF